MLVTVLRRNASFHHVALPVLQASMFKDTFVYFKACLFQQYVVESVSANQGFEVHLVEREKELGGCMRKIHYLLEEDNDPQETLKAMIGEVEENERIDVYLGSEVVDIAGLWATLKQK